MFSVVFSYVLTLSLLCLCTYLFDFRRIIVAFEVSYHPYFIFVTCESQESSGNNVIILAVNTCEIHGCGIAPMRLIIIAPCRYPQLGEENS